MSFQVIHKDAKESTILLLSDNNDTFEMCIWQGTVQWVIDTSKRSITYSREKNYISSTRKALKTEYPSIDWDSIFERALVLSAL